MLTAFAVQMWGFSACASAEEEVAQTTRRIVDGLALNGVQELRLQLLPGAPSVRETVLSLASGGSVSPQGIMEFICSAFVSSVLEILRLLPALLLPALLCAIVLQTAGGRNAGFAFPLRSVCFLLVLIPVVLVVISELEHARDTITGMTERMDGMLPVLLTLLTALGGNASSAFLHPMVVAASGSMVFLAREVILRLVMCTCAVTTVNHLSDGMHLSRMAQLLRSSVCWLLGVSFTVFLGAMSLQGVCSASIDGVTIRAAKYAVDNFVPVVGGMFSDTMDTLVGCTLIVKNALGVTAVLVLLCAILGPMLRTMAVVLIMKLSAALMEPVADAAIVRAVGDFSQTVVLFAVTMLCVGAMYFLLIVQMMLVGNLTVLLR